MPLSSNMSPVPSVGQGITWVAIPMDQLTASVVATLSEVQLTDGLRAMWESSRPRYLTTQLYRRIHLYLSEAGRYDTSNAVRSLYLRLLREDSGTQQSESNSSSPTTTKTETSRVSKPVILINIAARKPSTTTKVAPQQFSLFTSAFIPAA